MDYTYYTSTCKRVMTALTGNARVRASSGHEKFSLLGYTVRRQRRKTGKPPMLASAILLLIVLFALPLVLDHGGSFREVDDERGR